MDSFEISTRNEFDIMVVKWSGSADVINTGDLEPKITRILSDNPSRLVVDLTELTFISSLGIGQLVLLCETTRNRGGSVCVACPDGNVRDAFEVTKLDQRFPFTSELADALKAVAR